MREIIPFPVWIIPFPVLKINFDLLETNYEHFVKDNFSSKARKYEKLISFPVWIFPFPIEILGKNEKNFVKEVFDQRSISINKNQKR